MKEILTKNHNKFKEFIKLLSGNKGCDFQDEGSWLCHNDFTYTRKILNTIDNIDIEETIKYFNDNGAYCDCEIIFNIGA